MRAAALALLLVSATAAAAPGEGRCRATALSLESTARDLEDKRRSFTLEEARTRAADALAAAVPAETGLDQHVFLLPWLEHFRASCARDASREDLAERLRLASERVASSCASLAAPLAAPAAVDRARIVEILSRPEYELRSRDEQFLARLLRRVWTWLRDVFVQSETVQQAALSTRAAFLVAVCLVTGWLAFKLARVRLARRRRVGPAAAGAVALDDPDRYDAAAAAALARGEAREAVRNGLLCVLATLERARLASPGRADTNREVAEHLAARGAPEPLSEAVRALVAWYDRAWYGLAAVSADEARAFVERARAARAQVAGVRPREAA